jgi:hypothetical protein
MGLKKVAKTATGIFAGSLAVDAFKAEQTAQSPLQKLGLKAAGSIAASTAFHVLKGDVVELVQELQGRKKLHE